jgi:nicotinate-nucleotide adenylyltransferase
VEKVNKIIMKIGLYFGSFNPIHVGHLIIANHIAEYSNVDQVWMVVTPHNPHKKKDSLLNDYQRLELVHKAVENYSKIKASDFEFSLPQPNYTVNTISHLQDKYSNFEFALIMGADNLKSFHKWKNYETILKNHEIFVYPRLDNKNESNYNDSEIILNISKEWHQKIHFIMAPVVEISSTFIRENIKNKKNVQPLLPLAVWEYIDYNNLYKK